MKNRTISIFALIFIIPLSIGIGAIGYSFIEKKIIKVPDSQPEGSMIDIKKDVFRGSEIAYGELRTAYLDYPDEDFLFWALYRANRFQDKDACNDVARILCTAYDANDESLCSDKMDSMTRKLYLQYSGLADSAHRSPNEK